ncbi:phosphatase PAP2 family protein [Yoonia sp. R2331]|uniref:phosphatase PAP2 family protein n=1 Tax=Yoonia sp. R2331 TaxID=3237238 RepID=UPI0034E3A7FC
MSRLDPLYRPAFLPGEIILLVLTALIAAAAILSSVIGGQPVDWLGFAPPMIGGMLLVVVGAFVRQARGMERLALLLIGVSIYLTFGAFVAIFIFMFFPITGVPIDPVLMQIDATVGYSWPDAVRWLAQYPSLGKALAFVYNSSLWQLLAVIGLLALLRREADMHRFILTGALALLGTLGIWVAAPSFGPAAFFTVGPEVEAAASLVVNEAYGARLMDLARNGVGIITPETIIGSIAFPSYHTLMMCLTVWFVRKTPFFWPVALINIPMVPAILIHGGHHMIDMAGGVAMFAAAMVVSRWVVNPARRSPAFRHRPI